MHDDIEKQVYRKVIFNFKTHMCMMKGLFTRTRDSELARGNMVAPGQALPRVHMMISCPGTTLPRVNFITPGQVQRYLITTNLSE